MSGGSGTTTTDICWANGLDARLVTSTTATQATTTTTFLSPGSGICFYLKKLSDIPLTSIQYTWMNANGTTVAFATASGSLPSMLALSCNGGVQYNIDTTSAPCQASKVQLNPSCSTAGVCTF
jgi:hypothetical protein